MTTTSEHKTVTDYLNALVWDGLPRIDRWLVDYAGAENTPAVRAASRTMLVAAVRRAREPGCRCDQMPVIVGPEGCGKSSALRLLGVIDSWVTDQVPIGAVDQRHVIEVTAGKWLVEASELGKLDVETAAAFKAFLARSHDEARLPYQREVSRVARGFIVIGTTGSTDYLQDTSHRRFWPVSVKRFDLKGLAEVRDQLWAEAAVAEASGEQINLGTRRCNHPLATDTCSGEKGQHDHPTDLDSKPGHAWDN
jgi:predicted P-loop ATPase